MKEHISQFEKDMQKSRTKEQLTACYEVFNRHSQDFLTTCAPADLASLPKSRWSLISRFSKQTSIEEEINNALAKYQTKSAQLAPQESDMQNFIQTKHAEIERIAQMHAEGRYSPQEASNLLQAIAAEIYQSIETLGQRSVSQGDRTTRRFTDLTEYLERVQKSIPVVLSEEESLTIEMYEKTVKDSREPPFTLAKLKEIQRAHRELLDCLKTHPSQAFRAKLNTLIQDSLTAGVTLCLDILHEAQQNPSIVSKIQTITSLQYIVTTWIQTFPNDNLAEIKRTTESLIQEFQNKIHDDIQRIKQECYDAPTLKKQNEAREKLINLFPAIETFPEETWKKKATDLLSYIQKSIAFSTTKDSNLYMQNECYRIRDTIEGLSETFQQSRDASLLQQRDQEIRKFLQFAARWGEGSLSQETRKNIEDTTAYLMQIQQQDPIPDWHLYINEGTALLQQAEMRFARASSWEEKVQVRESLKKAYDLGYSMRFPTEIPEEEKPAYAAHSKEIQDRYDRFCLHTAQELFQTYHPDPPRDLEFPRTSAPIPIPLPSGSQGDIGYRGLGPLTDLIQNGSFVFSSPENRRKLWQLTVEPQLRNIPHFAQDRDLQDLIDSLPSDEILERMSQYFTALQQDSRQNLYGTLSETIRSGSFVHASLEEKRKQWKDIARQLRTIPFFNQAPLQADLKNAPNDECLECIAHYFHALRYRNLSGYTECNELLAIKGHQSLATVAQTDYVNATLDPGRISLIQDPRQKNISTQLQEMKHVHHVEGISRIKGDGNCYYRSIMYGYFKQIQKLPEQERISALRELTNAMSTVYSQLPEHERSSYPLFINFLKDATENPRIIEHFDAYLLLENSFLDRAMIMGLRYLLANWLQTAGPYYIIPSENQGSPTILGDSLNTYAQYTCGLEPTDNMSSMQRYIDERVKVWGTDAEGPVVDMGLYALILPCKITNILLDPSQANLTSRQVGKPDADIEIKVLLRPGHYDLLYGNW
jgi:hypothetical protein